MAELTFTDCTTAADLVAALQELPPETRLLTVGEPWGVRLIPQIDGAVLMCAPRGPSEPGSDNAADATAAWAEIGDAARRADS